MCEEYLISGSCSLGSSCQLRHPWKCRYWRRGYCWRTNDCVFLHKPEDLGKESSENTNTVEDDVESNKDDDPNRTEGEREKSLSLINASLQKNDDQSIEAIMTKAKAFEFEESDLDE